MRGQRNTLDATPAFDRHTLEEKIAEFASSPQILRSTTTHLDSWAANVRQLLAKRDASTT